MSEKSITQQPADEINETPQQAVERARRILQAAAPGIARMLHEMSASDPNKRRRAQTRNALKKYGYLDAES